MLSDSEGSVQALKWVMVIPGIPYFMTEDGAPWHPIGHNDAIGWEELNPLFRRRDVSAVDTYLQWLVGHNVTCIRLMLEYAQTRHRYFETALGKWSPNVISFWDDLFRICERRGIRILLTPFDTFWMWLKFKHHPYSKNKGGPLDSPSRLLLCRETRRAIKARLTFAAERWGGSGALFAWDIWNEIHPAHAGMSAAPFMEFIEDLSRHLRTVESRCFGRSHPQTVSIFGPELNYRPEMQMRHPIFRHPSLDFATIHVYRTGTIDDPRNTVDAAIDMGTIVEECVSEIVDNRPFLDSEHGPIHRFKDRHKTLPENFDDEYFRHMQWAHLASGGAGGGMRWPNRHPHSLTHGMRLAQAALGRFLPIVDWLHFNRVPISNTLAIQDAVGDKIGCDTLARFGCASKNQAILYLLRRDTVTREGLLDRTAGSLQAFVRIPELDAGIYQISAWDPLSGMLIDTQLAEIHQSTLTLPPFHADIALAVTRRR